MGRTNRRAVLASVGSATVSVLAGCLGGDSGDESLVRTPAADEFDAVVDSRWLDDTLDDVTPIDIRDDDAFTDEHIAGARQLPELLRDHYGETDDGYQGSADGLESVFEEAGVERTDDVVVYGQGTTLWATYGVYTLRAIGHEGDVFLLDGGFTAWNAADGETETGTPDGEGTDYHLELNRDLIAPRDYVADHVNEDGTDLPIVDNRTHEEYLGIADDDDAVDRQGHITGAINLNFPQNLVDDRFRSPADLESLWFDDAGLDPDAETISYCDTGVRGSVGWFVMDQLGWDDVSIYNGSWMDWGTLSEADGYYYTSGEDTGTVIETFA